MNEQDCEQLTLFPADSLASRSVWLENSREKMMIDTYGPKCFGLSENLIRISSLVRMYLESSPLPGKQFVKIWEARDTLSPFLILKLRLSERRTDESGCFLSGHALWKTPIASDANNREFYRNSRGEPNLSAQVKIAPSGPPPKCAKMWPTPTSNGNYNRKGLSATSGDGLATAVKVWPTPKAQNARGAGEKHGNGGQSLDVAVGGQLNPTWVEWLMGFPANYTDVNMEKTISDKDVVTNQWEVEPNIPRVATGVSNRVDRLKCLGNAVVPQQAYPIFRAIAEVIQSDL